MSLVNTKSSVLIRNPDSLLGKELVKLFTTDGFDIIKISPTEPKPADLIIFNDEVSYHNYHQFCKYYLKAIDRPETMKILLSSSRIYEPRELVWGGLLTTDEFNPINYDKTDKYCEIRKIDRLFSSMFGQSNSCVFRLGCVVGYDLKDNPKGFISKIAQCKKNNETFFYYGYEGKQMRDQLHFVDLYRAIKMYYFRNIQTRKNVYNIGGGIKNTIDINEAIDKFDYKDKSVYIDKKLDNIPFYVSNIEKAKKDFYWEPVIGLDQIISQYNT